MKEAPPELLNSQREEMKLAADMAECKAKLKAKDLPEHIESALTMRLGAAQTRLMEIRGEQIGILMAHNSGSDGVMKMFDCYIAAGGNIEHVNEGMKIVARTQKTRDKATGEHDRQKAQAQAAWNAKSTTERREILDQQRRAREANGEPQHHGEKHMFGSIAGDPLRPEHKAG